jgi:hypothetical protein
MSEKETANAEQEKEGDLLKYMERRRKRERERERERESMRRTRYICSASFLTTIIKLLTNVIFKKVFTFVLFGQVFFCH